MIASNEEEKTEDAEDETRLNMEKELLWKGIRRKIKAGKGIMDFSRRWKYSKETTCDRLLTGTAKHLQIMSRDKIALHSKVREYIAQEIRSGGFRLRFGIWHD